MKVHARVARIIGRGLQQIQDTAALFVALGGGWWNSKVPVTGFDGNGA